MLTMSTQKTNFMTLVPAIGERPDMMGLGALLTDEQIAAMGIQLVDTNWLDLRDLFRQYDRETQQRIAAAIIAAGGDSTTVGQALDASKPMFEGKSKYAVVWGALATASAAASAYHGYKRNQSVGWAIGWFLLGSLFPVLTPAVALAQGFGKPKGGSQTVAGLGLSMQAFIRENRDEIDGVIKQACPNCRLNNEERRGWVMNDEALYRWARRSGVRI